jgi:hypothetical protein
MKRITLLLLVVFSFAELSAQNRWNYSTGLTFSSFDKDLMASFGFEAFRDNYIALGGSASSKANNLFKSGGFLAVEHDFMISQSSFIKLGMRYTSVGDNYAFETSDIKYQNGYGGKIDGMFIWRPRIDYLAIPINYGLRPSELISIYGGITPHIMVKNIIRQNKFTGPANDLEQKWDALKNPVDAAPFVLFANVGMSYYARDGVTFFDLRISRSLGDVFNDPQALDIFDQTGAWNVELGVGESLCRKSKKFGIQE